MYTHHVLGESALGKHEHVPLVNEAPCSSAACGWYTAQVVVAPAPQSLPRIQLTWAHEGLTYTWIQLWSWVGAFSMGRNSTPAGQGLKSERNRKAGKSWKQSSNQQTVAPLAPAHPFQWLPQSSVLFTHLLLTSLFHPHQTHLQYSKPHSMFLSQITFPRSGPDFTLVPFPTKSSIL